MESPKGIFFNPKKEGKGRGRKLYFTAGGRAE